MRAMDKRLIRQFNRLVSRSGYSEEQITSASRAYELVARRQAIAYILMRTTEYKVQLRDVAWLLNKDYPTVIYSVKKVEDLLSAGDVLMVGVVKHLQAKQYKEEV